MKKTIKIIKEQICANTILLYMKGTPKHPRCGFSSQAAQILKSFEINFKYIDVLENPNIRKYLPIYSHWPTFPQLWVNQELIGGCNIIVEMFQTGELLKILKNV
ncbi:Grx4 family monothiol glutaredoxin [Buchnera aphidicola]|uniref:Glutaredoxin n=1 Tax=Buchnera aphidicola subsp. Tuberolachnus salignus TaxID=98804 RepID=A0A170PBN3_BUCTT|nr:Grx4 family monothiol glutaredoxin [Buchnera aphidicola]CUR53109.1 Glutaredoxin-4 [Buchnera aphidicola (Tuberolachnus salignus)]